MFQTNLTFKGWDTPTHRQEVALMERQPALWVRVANAGAKSCTGPYCIDISTLVQHLCGGNTSPDLIGVYINQEGKQGDVFAEINLNKIALPR